MAASQKLYVLLTKYFKYINQGNNVIYLQNMKFDLFILWPGGAYTDTTHDTKCKIFKNIYNFLSTETISIIPWL